MLANSFLWAQQEFSSGFIITKSGKYEYGYIKLNPTTTFTSCEFKSSLESNSKTYTPEQINGYGFIPGDFYNSYHSDSGEWRFLLVIHKGNVTLMKANNSFYIQKDELSIREIPDNRNKAATVLSDVFIDCPKLKKNIRKTKVSEESLLNLINNYEQCIELGNEFYHSNAQLSIVAGAAPSNLLFNPDEDEIAYLGDEKFTTQLSYTAGIHFATKIYTSAKNKFSMGVYFGLQYADSEYSRSYTSTNPFNFNNKIESTISIENSSLNIPLGAQFFLENKYQPYLKLGASLQPWSSTSSSGTLFTKIDNNVYYDEPHAITEIKSKPRFQFAIGSSISVLKKNRLLLELNLNTGAANSTVGPYSVETKINQTQILIGLIF